MSSEISFNSTSFTTIPLVPCIPKVRLNGLITLFQAESWRALNVLAGLNKNAAPVTSSVRELLESRWKLDRFSIFQY